MGKIGVDTSAWELKVIQRQRAARELEPGSFIFESCAGEGGMWAAVWHRFPGICCDINDAKVRTATETRSQWLCLQADALSLVRHHGISRIAFDVIDLDFYGSPWPTWLAFLETQEVFAERTHVFLTDGFGGRQATGGADAALFPGMKRDVKISPQVVIAEAKRRTAAICHDRGLRSSWVRTDQTRKGSGMSYHYLTLEVG